MLKIACCIGLTYLALVAQMMGATQGFWGLSLPAAVVVIVVRWFSSPIPVIWAFFLGLMLDGLGGGPLGLRAATFSLLSVLLPRIGFDDAPTSPWRWAWAVFLVAWWDGVISAAVELIPRQHWQGFENELLRSASLAVVTAGCLAVCTALASRVFRKPSWNAA